MLLEIKLAIAWMRGVPSPPPGSVFYIKYDKTIFPFLNYAGEEKQFDALFPRGGFALQARMRSGLLTTSLNTVSGKCEKSGNSVHLITSRNTRCVATLATLGFTQYKMWQRWTPRYIAAMVSPGNIKLVRLRLQKAYQTQTPHCDVTYI